MKNLIVYMALLILTSSYGLAADRPHFRMVQFKDGVLSVLVDTCGNQVLPVVTFKPIEEIPGTEFNYGSYKATLAYSQKLAPSTFCPYIAPSRIEVNLKQLLKEWSDSDQGTPASKEIFKNKGTLEILVSPFLTDIDFTYRAN